MPQPFSLFPYARPLLAFTLGSGLLLSCSRSPESAGKQIAALACDCAAQKDKLAYQQQEQLMQAMESGEYQAQPEAYARQASQKKETQRADSACLARPNALAKQAELDFLKPEDRATLEAAVRTNYLRGILEFKGKIRDRKKLDGTVSATIARLRAK